MERLLEHAQTRAPALQVRVWAHEPQVRGQAWPHEPSRVHGLSWVHEPSAMRGHEHEQWLRRGQVPWQVDEPPHEAQLLADEPESARQRVLRRGHVPPRELPRVPPHGRQHERSAALPPTLGVPLQAEVPPRVPLAWYLSHSSSCPCPPPTELLPPPTEPPSPPQLLPPPRLTAQARPAPRQAPPPQLVARLQAAAGQ